MPQVEKSTRIRIPQAKLDHFLSFLTSSNVVQDLPFGEKTLVLSTKAEIKVPNVIRAIIPESIVKQYQSYCKETDFQPMSRSTLCRIMKVCSATVRKSLQGLDHVAADGAQAFDDLVDWRPLQNICAQLFLSILLLRALATMNSLRTM